MFGLVKSCALLAVVLVVAAVLIAAAVHRGLGLQTLVSAVSAAVVCWLAGALALIATYYGNAFRLPVQGVLLGMMARLGLPLAALLLVPPLRDPAVARGATYTILGVYLVALFVETLLALQMVSRSPGTGMPGHGAKVEGA